MTLCVYPPCNRLGGLHSRVWFIELLIILIDVAFLVELDDRQQGCRATVPYSQYVSLYVALQLSCSA